MSRQIILFVLTLSLWLTPFAWATSSGMPSRAQRVFAFERAKVLDDVKGLDELDQDLLYFRAQNQLLGTLEHEYPQISKVKLAALQKQIRGGK